MDEVILAEVLERMGRFARDAMQTDKRPKFSRQGQGVAKPKTNYTEAGRRFGDRSPLEKTTIAVGD
ncbi:MAG: hypothetical protein ABW318_13750 [Vicinamibacterales bacterium]